MKRLLIAAAFILSASASFAGPEQDAVIAHFAALAKAADPAFAGFSAAKGAEFYAANHTGGGVDTPSCTTCHTADPKKAGQTRVGKPIDPMAASANAARFTDLAKVEKWILRNCNSVLGRECTPQETGDVISWLMTQ